jgi:hypothetical protein
MAEAVADTVAAFVLVLMFFVCLFLIAVCRQSK